MIIEFIYLTIWGNTAMHIYDYGSKENCIDLVNESYEDCFKWFENEIFAMVDDCEEFLSWEVITPDDVEFYKYL